MTPEQKEKLNNIVLTLYAVKRKQKSNIHTQKILLL